MRAKGTSPSLASPLTTTMLRSSHQRAVKRPRELVNRPTSRDAPRSFRQGLTKIRHHGIRIAIVVEHTRGKTKILAISRNGVDLTHQVGVVVKPPPTIVMFAAHPRENGTLAVILKRIRSVRASPSLNSRKPLFNQRPDLQPYSSLQRRRLCQMT